jgi:4a-hydroxytetrahydrobiopterin dehydratase
MELNEKKCIPCSGTEAPLGEDNIENLQRQLQEGWMVADNTKLRKSYPFKDFTSGLKFVQAVAEIAEKEQHHPDICLHYKNVEVELTTHAIGGLSENDFIMAAKIDSMHDRKI